MDTLTYWNGTWHEGNPAILGPRDHAFWLGSMVFDGGRAFEGCGPDLDLHAERVVRSARAAFEDVDPTFEAAARTLGAPPLRVFATVTLPLASSGVIAGLTLGFARCLGDFGVTLMVAGNIPGLTQTGALAVYDAVQANRDAEAAGMVGVMTSLAVFALYAVNRLTRRRRHGF